MTFPRRLRAVLMPPLLFLAFLLVLFEETIWRWARALGGLAARLPVMAALERLVQRLDPRLLFALFLVPVALLLPLKFLALWLIASGHPFPGILVIALAKMLGTAVSARLYAIAEPRLMQIAAFAWLRNLALGLLARAHAHLDASPAWQAARRAVGALKARARAMLARGRLGLQFAALRRWVRRARAG